jgi:membrane protein DedA with SNARE-associated domain
VGELVFFFLIKNNTDMFAVPFESILQALGYLGVFLLMISNGFISFPSSQILYIIAGYFVSMGRLDFWIVSVVGAIGNTIGNIILYEVVRAYGVAYITKWVMFPEREVKKIIIAFRRRGAWFLFVAKMLPAIKVFAPIPAGIAHMRRAFYIPIIFVSSWFWSLIFLAIGYSFGKTEDIFGAYALVLSLVALIVVGAFYKYMNSKEVIEALEKESRH